MSDTKEKRGWFRRKVKESEPSRPMFGGHGSRQEQLDAQEAEAMGEKRRKK